MCSVDHVVTCLAIFFFFHAWARVEMKYDLEQFVPTINAKYFKIRTQTRIKVSRERDLLICFLAQVHLVSRGYFHIVRTN